ncbi:MAG: hypothetical protein FWF38_00270 [Spirochaetaceae bacterium]|nr:hypothetical protein [Spirochaetaceae bacterium]
MRKIFLFLFILTALSLSQSFSQESRGTILSYTLNPTPLKTGDKGFIRIKLANDLISSDRGTISIKNNQWFHVEDIKINHEENEILIWFVPLDPALSTFPDFIIGDKIYSGIPLSVKSRLGNSNSLNLLGGKVFLPWTRLLFAAGFTLLVLFLFLFYYVIKIVPRKIRKTVILKSNTFKRKHLLRKMSKMILRLSKYEKTDYIKRFVKLLKEYLEIATSKKTTCFTTKEIIAAFPEAPSKELVFLDFIRFGNGAVDSKIITEASGTVYDFALMLEGAAGEKKI